MDIYCNKDGIIQTVKASYLSIYNITQQIKCENFLIWNASVDEYSRNEESCEMIPSINRCEPWS